jgi:antitoxin component of MazEF toxin-antitoxin module
MDNVITNVYTNYEVCMKSKIKQIGNSQGIVLPAGMLKALGLGLGDPVEINFINNEVIMRKVFQPTSLEELFEGYESDDKPELIIDDEPRGREW